MLLMQLILKAWLQIIIWHEVSIQRSHLSKLSDHLLKDVGLRRVDADREASRPFWDIEEDRDPSLRSRGRLSEGTFSEECELICCRQN